MSATNDFTDFTAPAVHVTPADRPGLWNPTAAGLWSLLLTPAFGAFIVARNWKTLGDHRAAQRNMLYFWGMLGFMLLILGTLLLPASALLDNVVRMLGMGALIGWWLAEGKPQVAYIKEHFGKDYPRKAWLAPLAVGLGGFAVYVVVGLTIIFASFLSSDSADIAEVVKPLIEQQWRQSPGTANATIQDIVIQSQDGGTYYGYIDATLDGESIRMDLKVVESLWQIEWEVIPQDQSAIDYSPMLPASLYR